MTSGLERTTQNFWTYDCIGRWSQKVPFEIYRQFLEELLVTRTMCMIDVVYSMHLDVNNVH